MISDIGISITVIIGFVASQDFLEEHRNLRDKSYIKELPKNFQIQGNSAPSQFLKHYKDIEALAKNDNMSILYNINVEILKPLMKQRSKKLNKKANSKKYNVPLKKNSMKLSSFEVLLRKRAAKSAALSIQKMEKYNSTTTEKQKTMFPKQMQMKYKPLISRVKTNYVKIVKPVRNKEIILTV